MARIFIASVSAQILLPRSKIMKIDFTEIDEKSMSLSSTVR
jgi:hypothetical protein